MTTNPHGDAENALATRVPLPMDARNAKLMRLKGAYGSVVQAGSGAPAVWRVGAGGIVVAYVQRRGSRYLLAALIFSMENDASRAHLAHFLFVCGCLRLLIP